MDQEQEIPQTQELINLGPLLSNENFQLVFKQIRETQSQHGLQHGDYGRYQKYCRNRVKKLRNQMQFKYGKRYHKRVLEQELPNDPRVLQVLLYRAENNWAHAMNLKQIINSGVNKKINKNQVKVYLVKKFKKAVATAKILQTICDQRAEKRTALEAEAYAYYLQGMYFFETEKWESAVEQFAKCYNIYNQIIKVCDQFESGAYQEKIEQLNQSIRYCNARAKKIQSISVDDLLKMQQQYRDPTLIAKLEEMLEEHRNLKIQNSQGMIEIEYQDNKYPIKNEKVIKILQKIGEIKQVIDLDSYVTLFGQFDEAIKVVKIDKDAAGSEQEKDIHNKVLAYLNYERQLSLLNRNLLQIKEQTNKFINENGVANLNNLQTKKALKLKLTSPQEIVRYCDNYLQVLKQIMDEERFNKDISLFKRLDAMEFLGKAIRCFFVSCLYQNNEKYREAYSLLKYTDDLLRITERKYEENKLTQDLTQQIGKLSKELQIKSKLDAIKASSEGVNQVSAKIEQIGLNEEQKTQSSLFEIINLDNDTAQVNLDNVLSYKPAELAHLMQPIPPKPIQLDIALSYLQFPQLEQPQQKTGGFWNKFSIFKKS